VSVAGGSTGGNLSDGRRDGQSSELAERAREVLEAAWQPEGYTVPNLAVYPHQWLWDSCFHAIVWAHLGESGRAVAELGNVFAHQGADGFVPHMTYWREPTLHASFWGRPATSCITQPPMYGHALAELVRRGFAVDAELGAAARRGLRFLLDRRDRDGLVAIVHPWESGCDDSPRWDAWYPDGSLDPVIRRAIKGDLVAAIRTDDATGSPIGSDGFDVASMGFNALVAFNLDELAWVLGDRSLEAAAADLQARIVARWDERRTTPTDHAGGRDGQASAAARTLESLLFLLGPRRAPGRSAALIPPEIEDAAWAQLTDPTAFAGRCGLTQVHRAEPAFDPVAYWRGPTWPQLTYLFWVAARRHGRDELAEDLRDALVRGARSSGFAEYWHPDTGAGYGAAPQSWTTLAAVVAAPESAPRPVA
jgi:hypothetical protein